MYVTRYLFLLFLVSTIALACCEHQNRPVQSSPIASPGQHWMQGEQLKKVMGQIAGLHGAFPKGLPQDAESPEGMEARRQLAELAAVADALANAARNISNSVANKPMSADDRRGFIAEAMRLSDQATALRNAARSNRIEPLQGMQDDINVTCISCHSRYRDISGDLSTHKASAPTSNHDIAAYASSKP